jgi:quinol monooxygenase YgiN
MITEIAQIDVKPGMEEEFESGVKTAAPIFQRAKGCRGMELRRSIEKPSRYRLFVAWETVENHNVDFRGSPRLPGMAETCRPLLCRAAGSRARARGYPPPPGYYYAPGYAPCPRPYYYGPYYRPYWYRRWW